MRAHRFRRVIRLVRVDDFERKSLLRRSHSAIWVRGLCTAAIILRAFCSSPAPPLRWLSNGSRTRTCHRALCLLLLHASSSPILLFWSDRTALSVGALRATHIATYEGGRDIAVAATRSIRGGLIHSAIPSMLWDNFTIDLHRLWPTTHSSRRWPLRRRRLRMGWGSRADIPISPSTTRVCGDGGSLAFAHAWADRRMDRRHGSWRVVGC